MNLDPKTDPRVLLAIQGDREALGALLTECGPAVARQFANALPEKWRSVLSVDDLMQETYTDAHLDIGNFVPRLDGSFAAWLSKLARNNLYSAMEMLGRQKRGGAFHRMRLIDPDHSAVSLLDTLGGSATTPSERAARNEAVRRLHHAVEELPSEYRTVVRLYDLEGKTAEEVATALNRSSGAMFMLRARAHRVLRESLLWQK